MAWQKPVWPNEWLVWRFSQGQAMHGGVDVMLLEAGLGAVVGKLLDGVLQPLIAGLEKNRVEAASQAALRRAVAAFSRRYPGLTTTGADEKFHERIVGVAMLKFLAPSQAPDSGKLAEAYHTQNPHVTVREAAAAFDWLLQEIHGELAKEPELAALVHLQHGAATLRNTEALLPFAEGTYGAVHEIKRMLERPLFSLDSLPRIREVFGRKSAALLEWQQSLCTGDWIDRPEEQKLHIFLTDDTTRLVLLLGPPGCGKSALMARLATGLRSQGTTFLALKADTLSRKVGTLVALQADLEMPEPLGACLERLADEGPVVLFVDQLDALCELMVTRHSERLSVLLNVIREAFSLRHRNLKVIASTRTFEAKHDRRLRDLIDLTKREESRETVARVELGEVSWEAVEAILTRSGVATQGWPAELRRMLTIPQHLDVFLNFLKDAQNVSALTAYRPMLEEVWRRHIEDAEDSADRQDLVIALAEDLAEDEELWAPELQYSSRWSGALKGLKSSGFLCTEGSRAVLGFRHQTLFDFARSKAFLRREDSLSSYVLGKQTSLFVRPILWSALGYLREVVPKRYCEEFRKLWDGVERKHLRFLLMEFLGGQQAPMPEERGWLLPCLDDPLLKTKAMQSMMGSQGWFDILEPELLPRMMAEGEANAGPCRVLLYAALSFAQARVVALLRRRWLPRQEMDNETLWTLRDAPAWDEATISVLETIMGRMDVAAWLVEDIVGKIAKVDPTRAATFLKTSLDFAFAEMERAEKPEFSKLLKARDGYAIVKTAGAHPVEFCQVLFPWFLRVVDRDATYEWKGQRYLSIHSLIADDDDEDDLRHYPLFHAVVEALSGYARSDPAGFLKDLQSWKGSDRMVVHRLLGRGLEIVASDHPQDVLAYLLEDPRRLGIGTATNNQKTTRRIIQAVVPALSPRGREQLENAICSWEEYPAEAEDDEDLKQQRQAWNEEKQLGLLNAFPEPSRSPELSNKLLHMIQKHGPPRESASSSRIAWIGSPVSAEEMSAQTDGEIVELFKLLHDGQDHHPEDWMKGGSVEASREFETFSEKHQERAMAIIRRFEPGKQERPAAHGFQGLHKGGLNKERLFDMLRELHRRGFASSDIRHAAASVLMDRAQSEKGLSDDICGILRGWLAQHEDALELEAAVEAEHGILWDSMRMSHLTTNSMLLDSVALGYICRENPVYSEWLQALDEALAGPTNTRSWVASVHTLHYLGRGDRAQAAAFVTALLAKHPNMRCCVEGAILLAHAHWWGDDGVVAGWFADMRDAASPFTDQAFGELAALRHLLNPEDAWCAEQVQAILDGNGAEPKRLALWRLGCAHTAAHCWKGEQTRPRATELLEQLGPTADEATSKALLTTFRLADPLPLDAYSERLFQLLLGAPHLLEKGHEHFLVEALSTAVEWRPDLVWGICSRIVVMAGIQLGDHRTRWPLESEHLVGIALTLHRLAGYQEKGLALYEDMLELEAHGAKDALRDIDRRFLP